MKFALRQIPFAARALARLIRAFFSKDPVIASPEVQNARMLQCLACPRYLGAYDQCAVCLCVVDLKISLASESCPLPQPRWRPQTRFTPVP